MLAFLWLFLLAHERINAAAEAQKFSAMFAFGDSLIDHGNNNYLQYSLAKANYVPYGVDFDQGVPTGRFCNGRTIIDFLGELLGFPMLPPYTAATGKNILKGVNYASAAGGILDETGRNLGQRFSLTDQVASFRDTLNQIKAMMGGEEELNHYLANSLVVMVLGSNDYINNYLQPSFYTSSYIYNPQQYADLLIKLYTRQILELHSFGLKKFVLGGIGPLGCIPNQLATGLVQPGKCFSFANDIVGMFNMRLRSLVDQFNRDYNGSIFVYGNSFGAVMDVITNATKYGITVTDRACCGIGRNEGQITCLPLSVPCANRNQYVFWDAFHPTQIVNQILATRAYSGTPSDCYPINIQQMAKL
ncbi:OLC1v1008528C1 [Oldenlandia corymbosa var. corymbosa]|uniref:OLC1v1008528C1 n=1 Tax=Oldenlandia corymbosa var. corymbosa TaxID=529605 RepID=A0AAV1DPA7_OLDCO|nr:OLC1v1008528C1 [Oldenlandia corymbosa var. corymbosa]